MKIMHKEKVIPQRTEAVVTYTCGTCGNFHTSENLIEKCPMCGKDMCVSCECDNPLLNDDVLAIDDWGASFILQDNSNSGKYRYICIDCMNRLRQDAETYLTKAQSIVDKFNQDIASLTERFIENIRSQKR